MSWHQQRQQQLMGTAEKRPDKYIQIDCDEPKRGPGLIHEMSAKYKNFCHNNFSTQAQPIEQRQQNTVPKLDKQPIERNPVIIVDSAPARPQFMKDFKPNYTATENNTQARLASEFNNLFKTNKPDIKFSGEKLDLKAYFKPDPQRGFTNASGQFRSQKDAFEQHKQFIQKEKERQSKPEQPKPVDLNQVSKEDRQKLFRKLQKDENNVKRQEKDREREQLMQKQLQINNPHILAQGQLELLDVINEGGRINHSIEIKKKDGTESKRMQNFKKMFEQSTGSFQDSGKPLFEYNRLLRYLFLRDYTQPESQDAELKVIPNRFSSDEEYCKIFEYLFLNESTAQLKQELIEFMGKKKIKFRKVEIKIDESNLDKDGTILQMRPSTTEAIISDQDCGDDNVQRDGNCDLTQLKNHVVLLGNHFNMQLQQLNQFQKNNHLFFGFFIDPHKATFLTQIRIQSFIDKQLFQNWTDTVIFPFAKITTIIREYQMITRIKHCPLADAIFDPHKQSSLIGQLGQVSNIITNGQVLDPFFEFIESKYNPSQAASIKEIAIKDQGICLLQGPPGTGKTHTLLGLLSAVYNYMTILQRFPRRKILICAPSNAAIDEIIIRILHGGIFNHKGESQKVKIVRMGLLDEENQYSEEISRVTLEDMAQRQLYKKQIFKAQADQRTSGDLRIELSHVQNEIKKLEKSKKMVGLMGDDRKKIETSLEILYQRRKTMNQYLDQLRSSKRQYKEKYVDFSDNILREAEIICATLSSSGSEKLSKFMDLIDILFVDEAAQCIEASNIIPLRLGIKKMVLIGDPKQLPATTFSMISNQTLYNRSLFERILDNDYKPFFLNVQYRMHSEIRIFPSLKFYDDKLEDFETNDTRLGKIQFFQHRVLFIHSLNSPEERDRTSFINRGESQIIISLVKFITAKFPTLSIGIICAYKAQVKFLKGEFKRLEMANVTTNTVDSFQGQEKDIILFSCVRSSEKGGIGFLSDERRMNVALTRAKEALFVIGNPYTLCRSSLWKKFLRNIYQRKLYRKAEPNNPLLSQQIYTDQWEEQESQMDDQLMRLLKQKDEQNQKKETYNIKDFKVGQAEYTAN